MTSKYLHNRSSLIVSASSKSDLIEEMLTQLAEKNISQEDIFTHLRNKTQSPKIPISIFTTEISPLRALVKYLHENRGQKFVEIAKLVNRDPRTIGTTYRETVKKHVGITLPINSTYKITLDELSREKLSILEIICVHLRSEYKLSYRQIGEVLNKNERTIWTVCSRARKKE